jgi:hypothetical protein
MQATPTEATQAPIEAPKVKKARSEAQMAALEAARKKAFELRAAKAKAKATPTEAPVKATEAIEEEPKEEVQYVRRPKAKKPKRVIVVQEESSSDSEIEIRLDKPKRSTEAPSKNPKYDRAYSQMFYV